MSAETWRAEYYPVIGELSDPTNCMSELEATIHSLRKWTGLRACNLKKHGIDSVSGMPIIVSDRTCALCMRRKDVTCNDCPLRRYLGRRCDKNPSSARLSPWQEYMAYRNPAPMIEALTGTLNILILGSKGWDNIVSPAVKCEETPVRPPIAASTLAAWGYRSIDEYRKPVTGEWCINESGDEVVQCTANCVYSADCKRWIVKKIVKDLRPFHMGYKFIKYHGPVVWLRRKDDKTECMVICVYKSGVKLATGYVTWQDLFACWEFVDGKPCGAIVDV